MSDLNKIEKSFDECILLIENFVKLAQGAAYNKHSGMGWDLAQLKTIFKPFRNFLPAKEGSRVVITQKLPLSGKWLDDKHFLKVGSLASVCSIDLCEGKIHFGLVFDDESWIDSKGKVNPVEEDRRHCYHFESKYFKVIER